MTVPSEPRLRPFVPRWTRAAALFIGVLLVGGAAFVLWHTSEVLKSSGFPGVSGSSAFLVWCFVTVGVLLLWRLGGVRADPTADGLRVRNVLRTRVVAWPEIIAVRFTRNTSWAFLDLADGTQLAVMGIQQSDGRRGRAEAERLRGLVDELGTAADPQQPGGAART